MYELIKEFQFEAAHRLPYLPSDHKCSKVHGHSFGVEVSIMGDLNTSTGWVVDFSEIKNKVQKIIDILDHKMLNEIEGLSNPTSENIAKFLFERISKELPLISKVVVYENPFSRCVYSRGKKDKDTEEGYYHEKNYFFNFAHFLIFENGSREGIHGHTVNLKILVKGTDKERKFAESIFKITDNIINSLNRRLFIQKNNKYLSIKNGNNQIILKTKKEKLIFGKKDVIILPIQNTTTELIMNYIYDEIVSNFCNKKLPSIRIEIDETDGKRIRRVKPTEYI